MKKSVVNKDGYKMIGSLGYTVNIYIKMSNDVHFPDIIADEMENHALDMAENQINEALHNLERK